MFLKSYVGKNLVTRQNFSHFFPTFYQTDDYLDFWFRRGKHHVGGSANINPLWSKDYYKSNTNFIPTDFRFQRHYHFDCQESFWANTILRKFSITLIV